MIFGGDDWTLPTLPVIDLVAARADASEDTLDPQDIWNCQIRWDARKVLNLTPDRRKELCILLVKLSRKMAPDLVGSDAFDMWEKFSKDPEWFEKLEEDIEEN